MKSILRLIRFPALCLFLTLCSRGLAAENVALFLTMNGSLIQGDSSVVSLGRENTIECLSLESEFFRPGGGNAVHRPVKIVKRIDKASPRLADSFGKNHNGECQFRFFRPNPSGDGTTQHFLTVELQGVRISSVRLIIPSTVNPATAQDPPMEEVLFTYTGYRIVYQDGGITAQLDVNQP